MEGNNPNFSQKAYRGYKGMHQDSHPSEQPEGSTRYVLNGINRDAKGLKSGNLYREHSLESLTDFPGDLENPFVALGRTYLESDIQIVIGVVGTTTHIGYLKSEGQWESILVSDNLKVHPKAQIQIEYRKRKGNLTHIYWVNGEDDARCMKVDDLFSHYTDTYKDYLKGGGNPGSYVGDKWLESTFNLIKTFTKYPEFRDVEVLSYGSIKSGSYNFAIQYVDEDLNPTEWITTSNTVNIYVDSSDRTYKDIGGSRNVQSNSQNFPNAQKSIKLTLGNLDTDYPYYRIAVIMAVEGTGKVTRAIVSTIQSIHNSTFIYSGDDTAYTPTPVEDITLENEYIRKPHHILQEENRLLLASTEGLNIDFCEFQKYASKIGSRLAFEDVELGNHKNPKNQKNENYTFKFGHYIPGECYSLGIVYIIDNTIHTPTFHIPGPSLTKSQEEGISLLHYETQTTYPDIHRCIDDQDYWGVDIDGNPLLGAFIRHHRFPFRKGRDYPDAGDSTKRWKDIVYTNSGLSYLDELLSGADANKYSSIFGLNLYNIERPHPRVTGFYIVRNDVRESDKIVLDNCFVGQNGISNNYESNTFLFNRSDYSKKSEKSVSVFSPEHQFFFKNLNFSKLEITGRFASLQSVKTPLVEWKLDWVKEGYTITVDPGGLYIEDVQAGTSYNPEIHTEKDNDGFDLLIGYRMEYMGWRGVGYLPTISSQIFNPGTIDNTFWLAPASSRFYNGKIYYNTCCDNKIGIVAFNNTYDKRFFDANDVPFGTSLGEAPLIYSASMTTDNYNAYSDFLTRPYYKIHNNPFYFSESGQVIGNAEEPNTIDVYGGDAYVSQMRLTLSDFYKTRIAEREKKSSVWQIVVGVFLIIAAVVAVVATGGLTAPLAIVAASSIAISYGVSLAVSGIKFEQMKDMIDKDYPNGLFDIVDGDKNVYSDMRLNTANDDRFEWYSKSLCNMVIEGRIPIELRVPITGGTTDFMPAPISMIDLGNSTSTFETYLTEKFTTLDRDRGAGRLYKGYPSSEVYDMNLDYMRKNKEKVFYHLPIEYDCCNKDTEKFTSRVHYSEQSFQEELTDNYRVFLPQNYRDIESEKGTITNLFSQNSKIYIHTTEGLWELPMSYQERVNSDLVSFIGTGELFSIPPSKVMDDGLAAMGSRHKWATTKTPLGTFFVSETEGKVYLYGTSKPNISSGMSSFLKSKLQSKSEFSTQFEKATGIPYPLENNPSLVQGIGIHSVYDAHNERILLTVKDYKFLAEPTIEVLEQLRGRIDGLLPIDTLVWIKDQRRLGKITDYTFSGIYVDYEIEDLDFNQPTVFENLSFTLSYSLEQGYWTSFHSYIPGMYFPTPSRLFSYFSGSSKIITNTGLISFGRVIEKQVPFIVELVATDSLLQQKTWENISFKTEGRKYNLQRQSFVVTTATFNKLIAYNSSQSTGELTLVPSTESDNYLSTRIKNVAGSSKIDYNKGVWSVNNLRDRVSNYGQPFFHSVWNPFLNSPLINYIQSYPIDKVVNPSVFGIKSWTQIQPLKDNHLVIRLSLVNFDSSVELGLSFLSDLTEPNIS